MKRFLIILCFIAAFLAALSWTGAWLSTPVTEGAGAFVVEQGEGTAAIVSRLKAQGVIRSELLFKMALAGSGLDKKLQPGTYDLRPAQDYGAIVRILATGGIPANEFVLLVKEGWNLGDVKKALEDAKYAEADKLYFVTGIPATDHRTLSSDKAPRPQDYSKEFPFLEGKPDYVSMEGFLFPDTYRIFKAATPMELVKVLLANFDRKLTPELRQRVAAQGKSVYDVVTMASIVEREVKTAPDRRKVADIFWRRIDAGIALQADSTVNYATGKSLPAVSYEDTQNVSRYNTYKYKGLPLGPISNPGLDAIKAAIDPEPNDYWYFLTDADGAVHYAKTLVEHNRNKAKYLR